MATLKQKKVLDKIMENHGNISKSMEQVGYTKATAKNPKNLTDSKGWQELVKEYLPDINLAKKHKQLLNSKKEEIGIKALDLGYKVKGSYAPTQSDITSQGEKIVFLPPEVINRLNGTTPKTEGSN